MRLKPRYLVVVSSLLGSAPALAATTLVVNLTTDQESLPVVPTTTTGAPRPTPFGTATLVLNDAMTALSYNISVFNIDFTGAQTADTNDNLVNAHFHSGPAFPAPPLLPNLPVTFGFIGFPFNETTPNDVMVTPFVNGVGGTVIGKWDAPEGQNTTLTDQLPNILAGRAYLNFHTMQFPAGEIRGNIAAVPEPATWASIMVGFGIVGGAMRLRRRRVSTPR